MSIDDRLAELRIVIPETTAPVANYATARRMGTLLYLSGHLGKRDGAVVTGTVGDDRLLVQRVPRDRRDRACDSDGLSVLVEVVHGGLNPRPRGQCVVVGEQHDVAAGERHTGVASGSRPFAVAARAMST